MSLTPSTCNSSNCWIIRAAAADNSIRYTLPKEPNNPAMGTEDLLSAAAYSTFEFLLRYLSDRQRAAMGLVIGTTMGCLEADREFDRSLRPAHGRYASPAAFRRTLPSTIAAEIALKFGIQGPSLVLSGGNCSGSLALRRAVSWMNHFDLDVCAAGAMDLIGPRSRLPEGCRVAILLLARAAHNAIGQIHITSWEQPDLAARWDVSLDQLISWTAEPRTVSPGAGIKLIKTLAASPASDQ